MRSKKLQIGWWFCVVRTGQPRIFNHPKSLPYTIQSNPDTKIISLSINQSGWRSQSDQKIQPKGSKQEGCLPTSFKQIYVNYCNFPRIVLRMMNFRKLELPWGSNTQWIRACQSIGILTRMAHPDRLRVVSRGTTTPTPKKGTTVDWWFRNRMTTWDLEHFWTINSIDHQKCFWVHNLRSGSNSTWIWEV